jgi:cell pole-organizing protein PopZ
MKSTAAAAPTASQAALASAPPTQKPSSVPMPDLASILSKVKALAAQSAASKSPASALPAPASKRPKVLSSSDEDDDKPLSARASSATKAQSSSSSSSKQHSSASSKHHSSHSSHDKKKKEHDVRASPSKSRNSSALLGDAGSEFKSVGHVFLSSDRSHIDKLIAGILSRWW